MSQPEARISRAIMTLLRAHGYFCFKVHGSEYMMSGLPDVIVCAQGRFIGLETKTPHKRDNTSAIQKLRHAQIEDAGGRAFVVTSAPEALAKVREVLAADPPHGAIPPMTESP